MYSSVLLALVMSVLTPTRFATIQLCNTTIFERAHCAIEKVAQQSNCGTQSLERKKISVADFSIVAGLEVGGDTFYLPPCAQPVLNIEPMAGVLLTDCEQEHTYVSVDLLALHSRRNI